MYDKFGLYIDGAWHSGEAGIEVISPVTEKSLGQVAGARSNDTKRAIDAAHSALPALQAMGGYGRAEALHQAYEVMMARQAEAAEMISLETGKPLVQAGREWVLACEQFRWYAEEARRIYGRVVESRVPGGRFEISREAVGIVGAFTAWNFPAALPARKLAPALAAGCSVVLRPSSQTPGVAMILVDCLRDIGLPQGAVNLVVGSTSDTYEPIMADPRVRKVSLTGSTRIGQQMIRDAADTVKKVSMELGGNAPLIVFEDADLEATLDAAVATKFANCGQVCVTADRFFVHESLYDDFVRGFVERTQKIQLGDGLDDASTMGPLINARRLADVDNVVQDALTNGATVLTGGVRSSAHNSGYFYEPTVIVDVRDDMKVFAEENFGPIAAIAKFSDEDEAFARANASEMGLSAYAFTRSPERARRAVSQLKAGMVGINSFALAAAEVPFGGTNFSGMGREGGLEGIEDYLDTKLAQLVF